MIPEFEAELTRIEDAARVIRRDSAASVHESAERDAIEALAGLVAQLAQAIRQERYK